MSFVFRLWSQDEKAEPSIAFEDRISPGYVPLWEAAGVYDALYNSDGQPAREISRVIAYGVDRLYDDPSLAALLPSTLSLEEAIRFLENVHRACVIHSQARITAS